MSKIVLVSVKNYLKKVSIIVISKLQKLIVKCVSN